MHQKRPHVSRRSGVGLFILATWAFEALSPASLTPEGPPLLSFQVHRCSMDEVGEYSAISRVTASIFFFLRFLYIYMCVCVFFFFLNYFMWTYVLLKVEKNKFSNFLFRYLSISLSITDPLKRNPYKYNWI